MCFRKAAGVVPLLQGLAKVQIASHARFAAKMDFHTSHLVCPASCGRLHLGREEFTSSRVVRELLVLERSGERSGARLEAV